MIPIAHADKAIEVRCNRTTFWWRQNMLAKGIAITVGLIGIAPVSCLAAACGLATLEDQYVFTGRGFIEAVEPGIQRVHYGVFRFDGKGSFTGKQSSSRGGKIGHENLAGTYNLDADCTGTMTFNSILNPNAQIHWYLYVTSDVRRGHIIRMDEGNMAVRSFEK